jgi:hypothetical protein
MPKATWGGKREGSGKKKIEKSWSNKFKSKLWKSLEKEGKKHGKSVTDLFAERLFTIPHDSKYATTFSSLWKSICEVMAEKETKTVIEKHDYGPQIGLPPMKEKPKEEGYFTPIGRPN